MSESTEFSIGSEVACSDGRCGELKRVVVDPVARAITHLAVEPRHRRGAGHLVPVDLVASTGKEIQLRCSKSEFDALDDAEETQLLPGASGEWGYDQEQMFSLPDYGLGMGGVGMGPGGMSMAGEGMVWASAARAALVVPMRSPMTVSPWVKWRCAAASTCMLRMGLLGGSEGWSSIPEIIT
jgi:hypothetical protein